MRDIFSRRHNWQLYQLLCRALKKGIGPNLFYSLRRFFSHSEKQIRDTLQGPSILIIDQGIPRFDHNSGDRRISEIMTVLQKMGYRVSFYPFDRIKRPDYEAHFRQQGIALIQTSLQKHLRDRGYTYDTVMICRVTIGQHCLEQVKHYAPQATIIFDTVDLHHIRMKRMATIMQTDYARNEAAQNQKMEYKLMQSTDCTFVVSTVERDSIRSVLPQVPVFVVSNIMDIRKKTAWTERRQRLLFVGNFYHSPNMDGLQWFLQEIFPLVRISLPSVELDVVGDYPPDAAASMQADGVVVHGHQPSIEPFFETARVSIAPVRFGAGVKGKLHMSMSEGVPFVTTSIGAEGMFLTHGTDAMIADTPADFAKGIQTLWNNRALWENMATASQQTLMAHFSPQVAEEELRSAFAYIESHRKSSAMLAV